MKTNASILIAIFAIAINLTLNAKENENAPREIRREKIQEFKSKIKETRSLGRQFRQAVIAGDEEKAKILLAKFKESFNALPEHMKNKIEEKHPGTITKIQDLSVDDVDRDVFEDDDESISASKNSEPADEAKTITHEGKITKTNENSWINSGSTTTSNGKCIKNEGTTVKEGNTVKHQGTVKNEDGEIIATREGTIVKNENTINREATVVNEKTGEKRTVESTHTKDGNTISYEKEITTQKGKTLEAEGTITKDGNTFTKEGTISGEKGTLDVKGLATKEGNKITGHSEVSTQNGETIRTRDMTSTKEGNTRNTNVSTTGKGGSGYERETVSTRKDNSIEHKTKISTKKKKNSFDSEFDVLGKGFKTKEKSNKPSQKTGRRAQ